MFWFIVILGILWAIGTIVVSFLEADEWSPPKRRVRNDYYHVARLRDKWYDARHGGRENEAAALNEEIGIRMRLPVTTTENDPYIKGAGHCNEPRCQWTGNLKDGKVLSLCRVHRKGK